MVYRHLTVYRHAVMLFDRSSGIVEPIPDSQEARLIAAELLGEWASVRGLSPISGLIVELSDYRRRVGYGMEFSGGLVDLGVSYPSRLCGDGVAGSSTLVGKEEHVVGWGSDFSGVTSRD